MEYSPILIKIQEKFPNDFDRLFSELDFVNLEGLDVGDGFNQINHFLNAYSGERVERNLIRFLKSGDLYGVVDVLNEKFESSVDLLTGFSFRNFFDSNLEALIKTANSDDDFSFSLVMCDLDNFKYINDNYGHQVGDDVLKYFSLIVKQNLRCSDSLIESPYTNFRYGGDEFVFLLPDTNLDKASKISERIRDNIEKRLFVGEGERGFGVHDLRICDHVVDFKRGVTCSLGVSNYGEISTCANSLLKSADEALYYSKNSGKNMVTVAKE